MANDKILDGKEVARSVTERLKHQVQFLKNHRINSKLVVILVGNDPASRIYVRRKGKACEQLSISSETIFLPENIKEKELISKIEELNHDPATNGILVQLPLPPQIDEKKIIELIDPTKDVDCFHPVNIGRLVSGHPYVLPCTPAGILEILKYYRIDTEGKHAVVLGRSNIVGKPMANMLLQKNPSANATVTVVHSRSKHIASLTSDADILIAAIGKAHFVNSEMVKEGSVVIDVGINRVEADTEKGYRLVGDVDFESVLPKVSKITPVPGGVGPMTIAMLMQNTLTAVATQNGILLPQ